jgi:hypothetical protein
MSTPPVREVRSWYSWPSGPTRTPVMGTSPQLTRAAGATANRWLVPPARASRKISYS